MISRDSQGIVVQQSNLDPAYADGGDSCARTGPLARSGSSQDILNIPLFIKGLEVVRHPSQPLYNDASKTSRDNLVQYMCADLDCQRQAALRYAQGNWVNKDFLAPDVRLYLYFVARTKAPVLVQLLGPLFLLMSIIWASFIRPQDEQNQLACMLSVLPPVYARIFLFLNKNFEQNLKDYWEGWRNQAEIGQAILSNVRSQAARN